MSNEEARLMRKGLSTEEVDRRVAGPPAQKQDQPRRGRRPAARGNQHDGRTQQDGETPPWGRGYYGDIEIEDPGFAAGWQGGPEGGWQDGDGATHGRQAGEEVKRDAAEAPRPRRRRELREAG